MSGNMILPGEAAVAGIAFDMSKIGIEDLREGGYLTDDEADRFIRAEREFYTDLAQEEIEKLKNS